MKKGTGVHRVLMTADAVGGVWAYTVNLVRHLAREGIAVTVATMGPRPSFEQRRDLGELRDVELRTSAYRLEWMDEPWRDVDAAGEWLLGIAEDVNADLVHVNGYSHAALPFGVPVVLVAHSCVVSWWKAVHGCPPPARYDEYRRRVAGGVLAARAVVAPTRAMLLSLIECHGRPRDGRVIANGIDAPDAAPYGKSSVFLAAGRVWDEAKNLRMLMTVAPELPWPVHIAGDPHGFEHERRVRSGACLGVLGARRMLEEYRNAGVFVHPAVYEPFGLAPLEAAASGCALVLADIPSLREIWSGAALFVPPNDRAGWVAALRRVAEDEGLRTTLARYAAARARCYEAARTASRYLSLYEEVTGVPARPASFERTLQGGTVEPLRS